MKKFIFLLIICLSLISNRTSFGEISEQEAKKFLDMQVLIVLDNTELPFGLYGKVSDVITYENEKYLLLNTSNDILFIEIKNISYIRKRKIYELQMGKYLLWL